MLKQLKTAYRSVFNITEVNTNPYGNTAESWQASRSYGSYGMLSVASSMRAIDIVASTLAGLPRQTEQPAPTLLKINTDPAPSIATGDALIYSMTVKAITDGIAYALIQRDRHGYPTSILPQYMSETITDAGHLIIYDKHGRRVMRDDVIRLVYAYDITNTYQRSHITAMRQAINECAVAIEEGTNASKRMNSAFITPSPINTLNQEQWKNTMEMIQANYLKHRMVVMPDGFTPHPIGHSAKDAEVVKLRETANREAGYSLGVPIALMGDTREDAPQAWKLFARTTVRAWAMRLEEALNPVCEQPVNVNLSGLLKPDMAERGQAYEAMRRAGVMSINECREMEGLKPSDDPVANALNAPINKYQPTAEAGAM